MIEKRIVLTGGPCSGKTSASAVLLQELPSFGIRPIFVPELATQFLSSGIDLAQLFATSESTLRLQELIFTHQLQRENAFAQLAETQPNTALIFDRGVMDGAAYMPYDTFLTMINRFGYQLGELMSRYTGVIHMVTAADGAPEAYNFGNPARYESHDQAIVVDGNLQRVWSGHPSLKIIGNVDVFNQQISFADKLEMVVKEVCALVGIPTPIQNERKFLVSADTQQTNLPVPSTAIDIEQTYLRSIDHTIERRIRKWGYGAGDVIFFYAEKTARGTTGISRYVVERKITANEYAELFMQRDRSYVSVKKRRYCFTWKNQYFRLDHFTSPVDVMVLEVQASEHQREVLLPIFLDVIKDVTDDQRYKTSSIAKGICPLYA